MTKEAEIKYGEKAASDGLHWELNKPFGHKQMKEYRGLNIPALHLREFSNILRLLQDLPEGARLLDLGVGPGWTSIWLAKSGFNVVGVDISPDMVSVAKRRATSEGVENVTFVVDDMESLLVEGPFDAVLIYSSLHHCHDEKSVLEGCFRLLKEGGRLVLVEPTILHKYSPASRRSLKETGKLENGYTKWYLRRALRKVGFKKIRFFYETNLLPSGSLIDILKVFLKLLLMRFFIYPGRVVNHCILAEKK